MKFLGKHWGAIASVLASVGTYVDWNQVQAFASHNKGTAVGVLLSAFLTLFYSSSPKDKVTQ